MWRFVHITDPHLAGTRDGVWNNRFLCSMMPDVIECLGNDLAGLAPDFLLITGDVAGGHSQKAFSQAKSMLDSLGLPYYVAGGNHDCFSMDSRVWFLRSFCDRLPATNTVYTFVHKNLRFCVLDPWWIWGNGALMPAPEADVLKEHEYDLKGMRWALTPDQFVWLETVLNAFPKQTTVIACHYPPLHVPDRIRHPNFQNAGAIENGELLMRMLVDYPQVIAVFCGHVHANSIQSLYGITQITTSALPEYPVEYREIRVYRSRMEIRTHALSDPKFAARSLIAGHEFTRGASQDRTAVLPFVRERDVC